jgi:hypothetical protein
MDDRPQIKIRWAQLRLMGLCALLFGLATGLLLPGVWPLMPFPAVAPVEVTALLGFLFGFVVRKRWVLALPLTMLISLDPPKSGFAGALIGLLVVWPFCAAASILGIFAGKGLQRRMLRRTLKAERRRVRARRVKPTARPQAAAGR